MSPQQRENHRRKFGIYSSAQLRAFPRTSTLVSSGRAAWMRRLADALDEAGLDTLANVPEESFDLFVEENAPER